MAGFIITIGVLRKLPSLRAYQSLYREMSRIVACMTLGIHKE
jgi:hypothetical protein